MIKGIVKNSTRSPTSPYKPSSTHSRKRTSTTMDTETTEIQFFAPRKPFHTSAGYCEYFIQLLKMAEIVRRMLY